MTSAQPNPDLVHAYSAVVCDADGSTSLQQRQMMPPRTGELLLQLRMVGLCGTDLFKLATRSVTQGTVLGHELVGTVAAVGKGVSRFRPGDRIVVPHHVACGSCALCRRGSETMCETFKENLMSPGGFADLITIRPRAVEQAAFAIPDGVTDETAVFMEPAACVLRGIHQAELGPGCCAVIMGAGSMGLLHLLVLKAVLPDIRVVMIDPDTDRCETARSLGAARTSAPGDHAEELVDSLTDGLGADAVFDTVGGNATLEAGLSMSRAGGTIVLFAHAPENASAGFDLNALFKTERRIVGTYSGALAEQKEVFRLICNGALDPSPLVTHHLPLDEFGQGVELAMTRQALKVVFTPSEGKAAG